MKNSFKQCLSALLTVTMLICMVPINSFAAGPEIPEPPPLPYFSQVGTFQQLAMNDLQKLDADVSGLTSLVKSMNSVSPIFQGLQYIGTTGTAIMGVYNVLKLVGIIEDPVQTALQDILKAVNELSDQVKEINENVVNIRKQLNTEFSNTDFKIDESIAGEHQDKWAKFRSGAYADMADALRMHKEKINHDAIEWAKTWKTTDKTDLRSLYNEDGVLLYSLDNMDDATRVLNPTPGRADGGSDNDSATEIDFEIVLPAEYLSVPNKSALDAKTYVQVIETAVKDAVKKAVEDGFIQVKASDFPAWEEAGIKTQQDIIDKISEDMLSSLYYEISSRIANDITNGVTYTSTILSKYNAFCASVIGQDDMPCALEEILEYLKYTSVFEGNARPNALRYFELIGAAVVEYGAFTASLVAMTPSISDDGLEELTTEAMDINNKVYDGFYTGHDTYCYPLKGVLSYLDVDAEYIVKAHNSDIYTAYSDLTLVDRDVDFDTDNLMTYKYEAQKNQELIRACMVDSRNLSYLYRYLGVSAKGQEVIPYLESIGVAKSGKEHSTTLLTPEFKVKDYDTDSQSKEFISYPFFNIFPDGEVISSEYAKGSRVKLNNILLPPLGFNKVSKKMMATTYDISGTTGGSVEGREKTDEVIAHQILYKPIVTSYPRFVFHDKATITETATDLPRVEDMLSEAVNEFTATVDKTYGALVLDYLPERDPYGAQKSIRTAKDLTEFLEDIACGVTYANQYIRLENNIDMKGINLEEYWSSSARKNAFKGYFNGNGKTISNLEISSSGHRVGLFRTTGSGAVIKDLTLKDVKVNATEDMEACAALIGYVSGSTIVDNVTIESGTVNGYRYVGGIIGETDESGTVSLINCKNHAEITSRGADAGGLLGNVGPYFLRDCENTGKIVAGRGGAGGMCGYTNKPTTAKNCKNGGAVTGYDCAGGISGRIESDSRFSIMKNNENTGAIKVTNQGAAGGIVGWTDGGGLYDNNRNGGTVKCAAIEKEHYAGGILGGNEDDAISLKNNTNTGTVTGNHNTGGIAGYLGDKDHDKLVLVLSNTNSGAIESTGKCAGGIVGSITTDNKEDQISFNTNTGTVKAVSQAGGIIGWMGGGALFDSNTNKASISSQKEDAGGIIGGIEDDKCQLKGSNVYNPYVVVDESGNPSLAKGYDYIITTSNKAKHAAKLCGWDGYRKASVNNDTLFATIFGEGNLVIILSMLVLLIAAAVVFVVLFKKRKRNEPEEAPAE